MLEYLYFSIVDLSKTMKAASYGVIPVWYKDNTPLFLFVQHKSGHWSLPKGRAEKGETEKEAAIREFEEETGIRKYTILDDPVFYEAYTLKRGKEKVRKTVTYYISIVLDPAVSIQEEEISDFRFVKQKEAIKLVKFESKRKVIREASAFLKTLQRSSGTFSKTRDTAA